MAKTQKRANTPEIGDAEEAFGLRNAVPAPTVAGNAEPGTGMGRCSEQVLPRDAAGYIHEMAIELKDIAESARHSFLAYLLDLVIEESGVQKRGHL